MKSRYPAVFLSLLWSALSLPLFAQASPAAQAPTTAPPLRQPGTPPQQPGGTPPKMTPTGLEANGGSIVKDVYTNSIYGFSLRIPPGWAVVPAKNQTDDFGNSEVQSHIQSNRVLLIMTENAPLKPSYQRKAIQIFAAPIAGEPNPKSAENYLLYSQKMTKEKGMDVEYLEGPKPTTINGQSYSEVRIKYKSSGQGQYAEQYVTTSQNHLLQFIVVSPKEEGLKDLQPSIQSLKFQPVVAKKTSKPKATRKK